MKLYCRCLNVCIEIFGEIKGDSSTNYPGEWLYEDAAEVEVIKITSRLANLLKEKLSGQWRVYTCMNCGLFVYASRKESNYPLVVNKNLVSDAGEISNLTLSENYSPAFKIVLRQDDSITEDMYEHRLHEIAANWLREEAQRTEERIKNYTDQQYAELENHRLRALKDDLIINRVITAASDNQMVNNNANNDAKIEVETTPKKVISNNKSITEKMIISDYGVDTIIFPLEDFENPLYAKEYPDIPSDTTEDEDDNSKMVQFRKTSAANLARSLPIPVPQYMKDLAYDVSASTYRYSCKYKSSCKKCSWRFCVW
ncbi:proline-rich Akt substrate 40 kDa isoform X2 [Rhodnius prolixus]|uniref:proline-rich Akt substrate 40 kDa isoform X2 n=1 Tax=Rhodnius prolixus TaxID=13249 RepID=UPI003D18D646